MRLWAHRLNISIVEDNSFLSRRMKEILRRVFARKWVVVEPIGSNRKTRKTFSPARSRASPTWPWVGDLTPVPLAALPPLRQIATACLRWLGNGVFTPSRGAWIWWKMWLMKANEFALDNKDSPPRFGDQSVEPVARAAAMGIGQIDSHQGRDNARHSIVFRPGAAGSLFPRRPRSNSAIHRASALSHSGGRVRDAG